MDTKEKLSKIRLEPHEKTASNSGFQLSRRTLLGLGVAVALILVIVIILTLAGGDEEIAATAPTATQPDATGQAPRLPTGGSTGTLAAGGYVEARRTALVWPGREGIVAKLHVIRGQQVKEGDLLLELDARTATAAVAMASAELDQARARLLRLRQGARAEELAAAGSELEEAEAQYADAKAELERLLSLGESELVPAAEVEAARYRADAAAARVETLRSNEQLLQVGTHPAEIAAGEADVARKEAALQQAEVNLDLTRLRAPFDGRVIAIELEPGEVVSLFDVGSGIEIADESEFWVRVDVPEDRLEGLELGDPAEVYAQAIGADPLAARVVEIAPKADRQSNTVEVSVAIIDPPPILRPDMSARVNITKSGGSE
ncbi:MAG: HlyD family efflux transporter periplasmic adaptor subunit [Acidobacteria bacterium]|nr:MAG: HlyD family efflux transporter periplasmic adaptor subunit [Acidobacteriota bacterium]